MVHTLKAHGYLTLLSGVEHTAPDINQVGYDRILSAADSNYPNATAQADATQAAISFIHSKPQQPFFLSLGLNETHRPFPKAAPEAYPAEDARYCVPPRPLPDTPETRADVADFKAAARIMDEQYGRFLQALDTSGLADNTVVLCFTDHGLQFPRHMCNLSDHGIAVYLIIRGPGGFSGGLVVDQLVSLIDLVPTVYDLAGIEQPAFVQGKSLRSLLQDEPANLHDHIFAEVNYHAAYEPMRCIRSTRYKYIRRFDDREKLVLANVDDTPSKAFLLGQAWSQQAREQEMLYDLVFDPDEMHNVIDDPRLIAVQRDLRKRLHDWMVKTNDPLIVTGTIAAPPGSKVNQPDDLSPNDPIQMAS
jgi:arylsulfatase A-like enzyme